jgi:hypothetical protein
MIAVLLVLVALGAVAGCGDDETTTAASSPPAVAELTADEIVANGEKAMAEVTSASFSASLSMAVEGDPEQVTDPMSQQLLNAPISFKMTGKSSDEPVAADVAMSFSLMGQDMTMNLMAEGEKAWIAYQDQWYEVPVKDSRAATDQLSEGALPTDQLKSAGLDPNEWNLIWELVGVEDVGGSQAYHVRGTVDPDLFAQSLMDAMNDPKLMKQLGGGDMADALKNATGESEKGLRRLQRALEDVSLDAWYEAETFYLRKMDGAASFDLTGQEDAEGLTAMDLSMLVELSGFNEPVEVTPPESALPLEKLMEQMFGGMSLDGATF